VNGSEAPAASFRLFMKEQTHVCHEERSLHESRVAQRLFWNALSSRSVVHIDLWSSPPYNGLREVMSRIHESRASAFAIFGFSCIDVVKKVGGCARDCLVAGVLSEDMDRGRCSGVLRVYLCQYNHEQVGICR
jgi:hypothetical protein